LGIGIVRIDKQPKLRNRWDKLLHQPKLFGYQQVGQKAHTGGVPTGPIETGDQSKLHWVCANREYNRNGRGGSLGRKSSGGCISRGDYAHLLANQLSRQSRQSIKVVVGPTVFNHHVPTLNVADFAEAFTKGEH